MRILSAARRGAGQVVVETAFRGATPITAGKPFGTRFVPELVLLAVSTPALISGLELAGVERALILCAAGLWSIVQFALLAVLVHRHAVRGVAPRLSSADAASLDVRALLAEATVRRDEERLHELRATVSGIGMTRRLLREHRSDLPLPARSRLEDLYDAELSRLERLVDDDAQDHSHTEVVDVASILDPLVESLRLRGISIDWNPEQALAVVRPDQLVEIVHNLLENAARHANGTQIAVAVSTSGSVVRIQVSDSGPGVPAALRARLFERGSRRDGSPGQGLGLHIARRLARDMGGDLRLDPRRLYEGAGFTLTLPASVDGAPCLALAE